MAEHAGSAEKTDSVDEPVLLDEESEAVDIDGDDVADAGESRPKSSLHEWFSGRRGLVVASLAAVVALIGAGSWLGFRLHQDDQVRAQRSLYVQVARQTAINLTTINYTEVDADIKRVLDSATGGFHEEFQNRSQPFVEVVKKVQSKTEGTIAEAGLLSYTGDQAQVLVAISVKTSVAGAPPDQEPRRWRMRLTVDKNGDGAKVSKVEFVP
jgi:Mce-associated membrane protein